MRVVCVCVCKRWWLQCNVYRFYIAFFSWISIFFLLLLGFPLDMIGLFRNSKNIYAFLIIYILLHAVVIILTEQTIIRSTIHSDKLDIWTCKLTFWLNAQQLLFLCSLFLCVVLFGQALQNQICMPSLSELMLSEKNQIIRSSSKHVTV